MTKEESWAQHMGQLAMANIAMSKQIEGFQAESRAKDEEIERLQQEIAKLKDKPVKK